MSDSDAPEPPAAPETGPRWRRWAVALLLIVAVGGLAVAFTPDAIRLLAVRYLEDGGRRTASIGGLRFNPFSGFAVVENLSVKGTDGRGVSFGRALLEFDLESLKDRRIRVRRFRLENAQADLVRRENAIELAAFPAEGLQTPAESAGTSWSIGVDETALRDLTVILYERGRSERITIARADIGSLTEWTPDRPVRLSVAATAAGGSVRIAGEIGSSGDPSGFSGKIVVSSIDLARAFALASPGIDPPARGRLTADMTVSANRRSPAIKLNGSAESRGLELADGTRLSDVSLKDAVASWGLDAGGASASLAGVVQAGRIWRGDGPGNAELRDLRWEGAGQATVAGDGAVRYMATGALALGSAMLGADGARIGLRDARIRNLAVEGKAGADRANDAAANLSFDVAGFSVATPDRTVSGGKSAWTGTVSVRAGREAPVVSADGRLSSAGISGSLAKTGVRVGYDALSWSGAISVDFARPETTRHSGSLTIEGIKADSDEPAMRILSAGKISAENLVSSGNGKWAVGRLDVEGIETLAPAAREGARSNDGRAQPPVTLNSILARNIAFDGASRVSSASVEVGGFEVALVREPAGDFRLVGSLLAVLGKFATPDSGKEAGSPPLTFAVGEWRLANGSRVTFVDRAADPSARVVLDDLSVALSGLDSAMPEKPATLKLRSKIGKFGAFSASGWLRPFADRLNLQIGGKIQGFELPSIRAYARDFLGYDIERGRLDAAVRLAITEGRLAGDNSLTISGLKVNVGAAEKDRKAAEGLPLETALSLLRDSNDVIRLDLPVSGDVADPKFDFSDAVNQAVAGAMKKAVLTTLSLTFPLGGVITAISDAGLPDRLGLRPVGFADGSAALSPGGREFLENIARMMKARPDVRLTLCGVATARDRAAMRKALLEQARANAGPPKPGSEKPVAAPPPVVDDERLLLLSKGRGEAVKDSLVRGYGIGENRLLLCAPNIARDENAVPRADITL